MTKIQKVVRDIENLQDFYKRTKLLRARIKKKGLGRKKIITIHGVTTPVLP